MPSKRWQDFQALLITPAAGAIECAIWIMTTLDRAKQA